MESNRSVKIGQDHNTEADEFGEKPLINAIVSHDNKLALELIASGVDVNASDMLRRSALIVAVHEGANLEVIEQLIKKDANVNTASVYLGEGYTPLMCAAFKGKLEITTALIQANANVNATDEDGRTALFEAVDGENKEIVELLIENKADVNVSCEYNDNHGLTPLMYAAEKGCIEIMRVLLQHGAKVNAKDIKGRSALFYAIAGNKPSESVHFLHEKDARLRDSDKRGFSAVSFCIETLSANSSLKDSDIKLLDFFKECCSLAEGIFLSIINMIYNKLPNIIGGNSRISNHFITNAIHLAEQYTSNKQRKLLEKLNKYVKFEPLQTFQKMLDILIQLGADPNSVDSLGNTALHYALKLPYYGASEDLTVKIISKLEEHGSRFDTRNHDGYTPLFNGLSIWNNRSNWKNFKVMKVVCQLLPKYDWYANETGGNGESVFHIILVLFEEMLNENDLESQESVLQDLISILKLFSPPHIIQGVTVNKRDKKLKSPLHLWASLTLKNESYTRPISGDLTFESLLKDIFDHLQACGIKLNDRDNKEMTPLHHCRTWSAVKCLVQAGAKRKDHDSQGRSPLLAAAHNKVFKAKEGCFFPDVTDETKFFFKQCVEKGLDLWSHDNDGESILSLLLSSNSFVHAQGLVEAACELKPSVLVEAACELKPSVLEQLLLIICKDSRIDTFWKSSLVGRILSCTARPQKMDLDAALLCCCRTIVSLDKKEQVHGDDTHVVNSSVSLHACTVNSTASHTNKTGPGSIPVSSPHLDILYRLRSHGAAVESCKDLCVNNAELYLILSKDVDLNQVPLSIPWTSYSQTHKDKLDRVARRQNAVSLDTYWYHKDPIGSGSFGHVFAGISEKDGREIAIKKIEKLRMVRPEDSREITSLTALADCSQVVKYIYFNDVDENFAYIVLELMEGHLDDYFVSSYFDPLQRVTLCRDLVMGIKYLHEHKPVPILHRDLKPGNILYKVQRSKDPKICLKIADFGLSSPLTTTAGTTVLGTNAGTRCWIAPEVISSPSYKHTKESDMYSCGLLLHYILSPQRHPFSPVDCSNKTKEMIELEIQNNMRDFKMEGWDVKVSPEGTHLIKGLLSEKANERPSAADSVSHPLFWTNKTKLAFLYAVGNQPEIERPDWYPEVKSDIETSFTTIVKHPTWNDARYTHMPDIYKEMIKKRNYSTNSLIQLIRFIRNAISHVSEASRPPAIRQQILDDAVFLDYFPDLVMEVYKIVIIKHDREWGAREEIKHAMSSDDI